MRAKRATFTFGVDKSSFEKCQKLDNLAIWRFFENIRLTFVPQSRDQYIKRHLGEFLKMFRIIWPINLEPCSFYSMSH